jgi:segregation and condensation protein A
MNRHRLGRDVFARGAPEPVTLSVDRHWQGNVTDLFTAYAAIRQRSMVSRVHVARRTVWSLADARSILERLIGPLPDWVPIEQMLAPYMTPETRATVRASAFSALLEMVREGKLEVRQTDSFAPLFVRTPDPASMPEPGDPPQETG